MGELKGLYVSEELHKRIKVLAAKEGKPLKEVVEQLLDEGIVRGQGNDSDRDKQRNHPTIRRR